MAEADKASAFEAAKQTLSKGLREAGMPCESALLDLRSRATWDRETYRFPNNPWRRLETAWKLWQRCDSAGALAELDLEGLG